MNKRKLNIGIFTYDFFPIFGGMGRHVYELYKQNETNKKINMSIFSPTTNNLKTHVQKFPETKNNKLKNIDYGFKLNQEFENIIKQYQLDLVHIHGGPGGIFLFKKLSVPVVYTTHHTYWQQFNYIKQQFWKKIFYHLEKRSYRFADHVISVSTDTQNILLNHYGIETKKISYIPNGISGSPSFSINERKGKNKDILYIGRLDKRKGIDFLTRTMKVINKSNGNITLHIVGTGKEKKTLEQFSKKNNLSIKFYGYVPDEEIAKIYNKITIQVVPSIFEGFGISALEGMAKGVPIVATNVDGIKSIIKNNYSGVLVEYGDKQALSHAIISLLDNPSLQQKYIVNASKELQKFRWDSIYQQTINVYESLVI